MKNHQATFFRIQELSVPDEANRADHVLVGQRRHGRVALRDEQPGFARDDGIFRAAVNGFGLLEPVFHEEELGHAEVREVFRVPKIGAIAGSHVIDGTITRTAKVRLLRDHVVVYEGQVSSLRRFKDDASEVRQGFDCGIGLDRFQDIKVGDVVEAFRMVEIAPEL
jgi:hypothetical protein